MIGGRSFAVKEMGHENSLLADGDGRRPGVVLPVGAEPVAILLEKGIYTEETAGDIDAAIRSTSKSSQQGREPHNGCRSVLPSRPLPPEEERQVQSTGVF